MSPGRSLDSWLNTRCVRKPKWCKSCEANGPLNTSPWLILERFLMSRLLSMSVLSVTLMLTIAFSTPIEPAWAAGDEPPKKEEPGGFGGRAGKEKARLLKEFGGSVESEEAVMLGLAWLTQKQQKDGSWIYDGNMPGETSAATGMTLLAFLGAGQSHKAGRYQQTVQAGLDWLVKDLDQNGKFRGASTMYGQGIATLALCEAYGLSQDRAILPAAQSAIDFIQKHQAQNGSWGYQPGNPGDNSIVGWQIQALHAASLTQDIKVNPNVIKRAIGFLEFTGTGTGKSMYGYTGPNVQTGPATNLTAIGLLMRYYIDGWRAGKLGFDEGVKGLMARAPSPTNPPRFDMYYYYYATQVVRFYGKDEWATWNEGPKGADGMRKGGVQSWLISLQDRGRTERGSWQPEASWIGSSCGRVGTTAMCLLTLEVYYRYTPEEQK